MATWHQQHNPDGIEAAYTPHADEWCVVDDPPNGPMTRLRFSTEAKAKAYVDGMSDNDSTFMTIIPPTQAGT
ncbi:MAG TPA: hypothetical protein VF292_03975 [Rhodanobacteraceae bacterium]